MGEMMRFIAHEVGHALGFPHNMGRVAPMIRSYRNAAFTQKNGIAASLMDYARFNYIAQPGDKGVRFIRQMGPRSLCGEWGYRVIQNLVLQAEVPTLDKWILEKRDPMYKFGKQTVVLIQLHKRKT
jgi:hypothetical protein